jgi:hypothetical protein
MSVRISKRRMFLRGTAVLACAASIGSVAATAQESSEGTELRPGNLVVSRSV